MSDKKWSTTRLGLFFFFFSIIVLSLKTRIHVYSNSG